MRRLLAVLTLALCLGQIMAWAQTETGQISGTVTDPTGAAIANARVALKNVNTGATRTSPTNQSGVYAFPGLPTGQYSLSVESSGFSVARRTLTVTVGSSLSMDVALEVGQVGSVIEVAETAVAVNTETQTVGATINRQQILDLPTITRNPYSLVGTVGNVSQNDPSGRGAGYAINGQRAAGTNVMLDGTANNDEFGATVGQNVPLDSVEEFSVLTNNFTAEYGRASSGVVNVVTKSGSNSFHGSAYEFGRYSALASNDFDNNANGIPKQVFTRNQFGYSIGGPVIKNKLFFFNNTEWIRVRSQSTRTVYVPTPDFIAKTAPATQAFFSSYGKLASNLTALGTYTKADLAARGLDVCKGLAATSNCAQLSPTLPLFQRLAYGFPSDSGGGAPQNTYLSVSRVDYNMSDKTQMFVRYAVSSEKDFPGTVSDSPYQGYNSPNTQFNNSVVYSVTHTFSPRWVTQTKVDFNRFNNQQPFGTAPASPTLYFGSATTGTSLLGNLVALPGYNPYSPGNGIPFGGPQNFLQVYHDTTFIYGKHNIRFGGSFTYLRDNRTFGAYETAVEAVGNNFARGMENFLTGNLYQFQAAVNPQGKFPCGATVTPDCTLTLPVGPPNFSRSNRSEEEGFYVQDSWKVTPRLTVNLGLRWDIFGTPHNKDPKLGSNLYLGSGSNIYQQIQNSQVYTGPTSPLGSLWNTAYGNVAPIVGVAYDLFGDGKTSLRGGYGRHFERNFGNVTFNVIQNPPNYSVLSLIAGQDLPSIAISTNNAGPLSGNVGSKALGKVSLRAVDPNIKTAYVDSFSAALEHRFGQNILGAIEYSGSFGKDQYGIANINRAGSGPYYLGTPCTPGTDGSFGTCSGRIRATQYSNINFRTNGGFSNYNAMNVRLDWRGVQGLTMRANYTWSHAIDTLSDTFSSSGNQANLGWLDPFHPAQDKGDAYYDLRHRFVFTTIWNVPFKTQNKVAKYLVEGWSLIPNFIANTGAPFSLYDCTNAATVCVYAMFDGKFGATPSGPIKATATPNNYAYLPVSSDPTSPFYNKLVNSSYYNKQIGVSDFGPYPSNMIGRNFFRGPGSWNLDFAIHKSIPVGERFKLQLRGEAFNAFNHANLHANTGDNDVSSVDYVSASYGGRRQVQVALRLDF